jgi:hypothetical protein
MSAHDEFELDDGVGIGERLLDIAISLAHDRRFSIQTGGKLGRRRPRIETGGQVLDRPRDEIGDVLGRVGVGGEHHGDRFTDIAHMVAR